MLKGCNDRMMYGGGGANMYWQGYPQWDGYGKDDDACYEFVDCGGGPPKVKCKTTKECVKTYKTYYKMYKICTYRLFKICSRCGTEFDYYMYRGACPNCR